MKCPKCQFENRENARFCKDCGAKARKKNQQARESISEAINIFEECEATEYLKQAKEALKSL